MDNTSTVQLHCSLLEELRESGSLKIDFGEIAPVKRDPRDLTFDSPSGTVVSDRAGKRIGVLFLSEKTGPSLVERSVGKAREAKQFLGEDLGSAILSPLAEGAFRGLSYAFWPWHRPLSPIRWIHSVQKRPVLSRILVWLRRVTERSRRNVAESTLDVAFRRPLEHIAHDEEFPRSARDAAARGMKRLASGAWRTLSVLQHGDLGVHNVLLPTDRADQRRHSHGFVLIDWVGCDLAGYPFLDLFQLSISTGFPPRKLGAELVRHCSLLSCDPADMTFYLLAALGSIGLNLGHFPQDRYRLLCSRVFDLMRQTLKER